jgi:BirA family transcriptional regulator, biotin operon repressor / biotin---[acetyl-CoA-carboxylase] ligase
VAEQMVMDYLQADSLKAAVAEKRDVVLDVVVRQSVDSTNSWCLQQSKSGKALPFACFAEEQTSGRGRRGKHWFMSAHSDIAMSLSWPFILSEKSLHLLPLSIALAIVETLESLGIKHVQIKWPNDVYVQGKKIAGILIETQPVKEGQVNENATDDKHVAVVIGLGLNYERLMGGQAKTNELLVLTDICEQIKLQRITTKPERNAIASALLLNVIAVCQNFGQASRKNLEKFRASYDFCKQKKVEIILDNKEVLSGVAQGINDNAEFLVLINGEQRVFNSAEVSVRTGNGVSAQ